MEQISYIERIKRLKSEKKITNERLSELTGIPLGTPTPPRKLWGMTQGRLLKKAPLHPAKTFGLGGQVSQVGKRA